MLRAKYWSETAALALPSSLLFYIASLAELFLGSGIQVLLRF